MLQEEADIKDKYQKYQNFTLQEKFNFVKDLTKVGGIKSKKSSFLQTLIKLGVYEKCENYLVPFLIARIAEGIVYFTFMRYCMDILKLEDPLYLLTGLAFFFVSLVGSFCLKFFGDVMRERKGLKAALAYLSPSNRTFWKQYEVELGYYHAYSLIQGYFMLFTFWYFKPGMALEVVLFGLSKYLGTLTCQPLAILSQWSQEHDYDHVKLLQHVAKRDGKLGLFAGKIIFTFFRV